MQFQVDCGASAKILPLKYAEGEELDSCSQTLVMWNGTKVTPAQITTSFATQQLPRYDTRRCNDSE